MDIPTNSENCNPCETVLSVSNDIRHVIPHNRTGYRPVAARKYPSIMDSNSIIKNKNVLRKINFMSGDYLEPIYANETSTEQFSFLELYCNKNFHDSNNKLKCINKCRKEYSNKKYGSYADVLRFASQLPFMQVDVNSEILDSMHQKHLKNFEKHKELNFSTGLNKKEESRDLLKKETRLQSREGNVLGKHELLDRNQNSHAVSLEGSSSQTGSGDYSVQTKNDERELENYNKLSTTEFSDQHSMTEKSSLKELGDSFDQNCCDKSKDFFDDAIMEHVRHHLLQLSSLESVVTTGPPSAITFHSSVAGKRINEVGKVHLLLRWSPENIVPDTWVAEDELCYNTQKTIPVSQLPPEALQPPVMDALGISGTSPRPGKRKRK